MKHQAITLIKFKLLCAKLSLPLWQVVGLLESIWLFAMHNARDGDLSRFSPDEIAAWLEYGGDASQLLEALIETRWLDREGDVVVIHNWSDHKPTWLKGVEARQLSAEPDPTECETKSTTNSHTESGTKCETKQVRVRVSGINGKSTDSSAPTKFTKPTVEEVALYCRERANGIDPQAFIDHYEQVGWVCGKNRAPMKCWRAAVRTWESKRREEQPAKPASRVATAADLNGVDLITGRGLR